MLMSHGQRNLITERIRRLFGGMPCRVQVAALPWRRGEKGVEVLLITSRGTGRWVLPKGWPEPGESLADSAAREAVEEAGVEGVVSRIEFGRYYYFKAQDSGMQSRHEVFVFPMQVAGLKKSWPEESERTRQWFSAGKAAALVRERDLGELISRFATKQDKAAA